MKLDPLVRVVGATPSPSQSTSCGAGSTSFSRTAGGPSWRVPARPGDGAGCGHQSSAVSRVDAPTAGAPRKNPAGRWAPPGRTRRGCRRSSRRRPSRPVGPRRRTTSPPLARPSPIRPSATSTWGSAACVDVGRVPVAIAATMRKPRAAISHFGQRVPAGPVADRPSGQDWPRVGRVVQLDPFVGGVVARVSGSNITSVIR